MRWRRLVSRSLRAVDRAAGRALGRRHVIVDVRNAMHVAVLEPITAALERDARVDVWYTSARPSAVRTALLHAGPSRLLAHDEAAFRRWDLYISADPWTRPHLRRCARSVNVFHGVAGKYDLDDPAHLPIEFEAFDRVLFINRDRMDRYVASGVVAPERAVLIGFPKIDRLVNGEYDAAAVKRRLGLEGGRPTALYAPTWSVASSLHIAGEGIVRGLAAEGLNVIVKLHPLSLDAAVPKYSGGIDWRARIGALVQPGRIVHVEDPDASPLLAASDVLVTDHSTIGFEFCLLDRPVIVFDTPNLVQIARVNADKVRQLRSAARVVRSSAELRRSVREALASPDLHRGERQRLASAMFFDPGRATGRALAAIFELLELKTPAALATNRRPEASPPAEHEHAYATRS